MENVRRKEILEEVVFLLGNEKMFRKGICDVLTYLYEVDKLTFWEWSFLKNFLKNKKPKDNPRTKYREFTKNKYWLGTLYWWNPMYEAPETRQIRIDYLTKVINNIK